MPWWAVLLAAVTGLLVLTIALIALWVRKEWLAIPPDERRPWREIRTELGGFWPALRDTVREASDFLRMERAITRRMDENARHARRELIKEQRERVRQQIRDERGT